MNEEIYQRPLYDDKLHIKNFLLAYKNLVRLDMMKNHQAEYMKQLGEIQKLTQHVDFSRTTLFICRKDISKELFLVGFSRLKQLRTYLYCSMVDLIDMMWGNRKASNPGLVEEEQYYSEQDVLEDVLCVYVSSDLNTNKSSRIIPSVITNRLLKTNKKGEELITWVFFCGDMESFKFSDYFLIQQMFETGKDKGFQIVNLNSERLTAVSKSVPQHTTASELSDDLEDIY